MSTRKTLPLAMILVSVAAGAASAQDKCSGIPNDKERLACYDAASGTKEPAAPAEAAFFKSPNGRAAYAIALQRTLLSNNLNFQVMAPEKPDPSDKTKKLDRFPELIVFGPLDNSLVFRLITEGQVLQAAKDRGFQMVQFYSRGAAGGGWWYDLSGPNLPTCDVNKRLCL